jgi:hypothetical protein
VFIPTESATTRGAGCFAEADDKPGIEVFSATFVLLPRWIAEFMEEVVLTGGRFSLITFVDRLVWSGFGDVTNASVEISKILKALPLTVGSDADFFKA